MGKRKRDTGGDAEGEAVRWEMSLTLPGPRGRKVERQGEGIIITNYVPLEEWPAERRLAWERLWRDLLLTPPPPSKPDSPDDDSTP